MPSRPHHPPHSIRHLPLIIRHFSALLLLFTFLFAACSPDSSQKEQTLFIVSPHGSDIRREFQAAFSTWHQAKYGSPVKIQWPDIGGGGTGNIIKQLDIQYKSRDTCDFDLVFGGGSASFDQFVAKGYLTPLPQKLTASVPAQIHGTDLHGPNNGWVAATMSNFGIVVNKDRMAELSIPLPRTWEDLTASLWFGQLSLADPSKSGSVRTSYEMLFQQYGWERGWADMVLLFANTETVREAGSNPADDVGSAQAVGGIVIDFFGRKHITRVGSHIVAFIIPERGSTIDPDPIALLKGAPNETVALHFIEFVVSPEGQRLWTHQPHTTGGPARSALGRLSVLPQLYASESNLMTDPADPFTLPAPLKADQAAQRIRSDFIGDLIKYALIDNHEELVRARRAIHKAGDPPDLLARLGTLPTYLPSELTLPPPTTSTSTPSPPPITPPSPPPIPPLVHPLTPPSTTPISMTSPTLQTVRQYYKPSDQSLTERNQAAMRARWQNEFHTLFLSLEQAAKNTPKTN